MAGTDQHHARAIGEKLRAVRQDHNMTLRELAKKADISASMLSLIETGKAFPSVRSLYNIAAALGVTVDHFFPEQNNQPIEEGIASISAGDLTASEMRSVLLNRNSTDGSQFTQAVTQTVAPSPVVHANRRPTKIGRAHV